MTMLPIFANPTGLWMLLGVPAILAIHFLQQRAHVARTSTWFLIEKLAPDSARGRTWDRLRTSRSLWLQVAAVILAAWVLAAPRWVRAQSAQTVVIVLDASVSMDAFRQRAIAVARREISQVEGLAARTTWVIMTSNPRQPPLYRGTERLAAENALLRWQPELGRHDATPALRLARNLAGASGRTLMITDARDKSPADQRAIGVGQPIENVGFAGATVAREDGGFVWRALVKNHSASAQRRTWHLEAGGSRTPEQSLQLEAGAMKELSARFPTGVERVTVVLSDDGFRLDNRAPLIVPVAKPLSVTVEGNEEPAPFFRKLAATIDGVTVSNQSGPHVLRLAQLDAVAVNAESQGGIFWPPPDRRAQAPLLAEPVTPERDALVNGLNWQGWFGTGPYGFTRTPADTPLLWHGKFPLVLLRAPNPRATNGRKLLLAFDWATSNASRLPATVLLARRFLEAERDAQRAPYSSNFDCGARVPLAGVPLDGAYTLAFESADASAASSPANEPSLIPPSERSELRAPGRPGFFTIRRDAEVLVHGATQFSDPRAADFRTAERFVNEMRRERDIALERNTAGDPFVDVWLVLVAGLALASGWSRARGRSGGDVGSEPSASVREERALSA